METCLIQHEDNDDVVRKVKDIGRELGISAYSEETGRGLLRHVVVKKAFRTGEMMVVLVTNGRDIPHLDAWLGKDPRTAAGCSQHLPERQHSAYECHLRWRNPRPVGQRCHL